MMAAAATAVGVMVAVVASRCDTLRPDDKLLENCQKEARAAPRGPWTDDDIVAPWECRRRSINPRSIRMLVRLALLQASSRVASLAT